MTKKTFKKLVWRHYANAGRSFPWRETNDPYAIFLSEVMLQQTQTQRVLGYYHRFLEVFPTVEALAAAPLGQVLSLWQGLGYNRRAKALHQAAKIIVADFSGEIPAEDEKLVTLPGVGVYTREALKAFIFEQKSLPLETNIRTALIHHFFPRARIVSDVQLRPLLADLVAEEKSPRTWYYALMDYGVWLKSEGVVAHRKSKLFTKQSAFKGSNRELRGKILKTLVAKAPLGVSKKSLRSMCGDDDRFDSVLAALLSEGLCAVKKSRFTLP